jgi:hypothetical protein
MAKIIRLPNLLLAAVLCAAPLASFAQIGIGVSVHIAPPALPVYVQPPCPTAGFLWTPGYWDYGTDGYFWVPGVWVAPPRVGVLWTPGYWGVEGGVYGWHGGYWGPHVGFYGGVNYGFGYGGVGFVGGVWAGSVFRYNTAVVNVNRTVIHDTYVNRTVINNEVVNNHVSFNGPGGLSARPTPEENMAMHESHIEPTANQIANRESASRNRNQLASANGGKPETTAMNRVNGRAFNQQGRIANGAASGQLNARQTEHLEGRESNLNQTIRSDRQGNGGRLTSEERENVNRRQNNESRSIERDKEQDHREPRENDRREPR